MKKKFLSLALALVTCLSLAVPALAIESDAWTEDFDTNTTTLKGGQDQSLDLSPNGDLDPTVVLTPGTKTTLNAIYVDAIIMDSKPVRLIDLTFKGTGELVLYSTDSALQESGVLTGDINGVNLQDGLTMTGGSKPGDSYPITFEEYRIPGRTDGYVSRKAMANGAPATYIRIAPAAGGTKPAETTNPSGSSTGFTDVAAGSPYAEAIQWAVEKGITKGTSATTFSPNSSCTIGQIWTFLWRANGSPSVRSGRGTSDMDVALSWAESKRYIGEAVKDHAGDPCTRMSAVNYLYAAMGSPKSSTSANFTDVQKDWGAYRAICWAVETGVTAGTSATTFSPSNTCTRGQIVTFLYRAMK